MSVPLVIRHRVRSYELDIMGHVNNAVYLQWLEQARLATFEALGYPLESLIERRWMTTVARIEIDYRCELRFGDRVAISTALEGIGTSSIALRHRIEREADEDGPGEDLASEARVVLVWLGQDRRPKPVPEEVRQALSASLPASGNRRSGGSG